MPAEPPPQPPYRAATLRPDPAPPSRRGALRALSLAGFVAFLAAGAWSLERHRTHASAPPASAPESSPLTAQESWVAGTTEDGAVAIVRRDARLAASRGPARSAPVRFAANVAGVTRVAGGWVFVTADGSVARADSFLGEPRDLGRLPCAFRVDRVSRGLATAVDADGALLTTDGAAPFARVATPALVRAAAFATASFGAAILRDGAVIATRDGGRSWRAVDLRGDVAWAFGHAREGLIVRGATARHALSEDGSVREAGAEDPPPWPQDALEPADRIDRTTGVFQSALAQRCPEVEPAQERAPARRFVCHIGDGVPAPTSPLQPECPGDDDGARDAPGCEGLRPNRLQSSDAYVLARRRVDADEAIRWSLGWRSTDARGPFTARTSVDVVAWPVAADEGSPSIDNLQALAVTRAGVALLLGRELFWAARGAGVTAVREPFLRGAEDGGRMEGTLALDLPDGGALLLLIRQIERGYWDDTWQTRGEGSPGGFEESVGVALELGPSGAVRARRAMIFAPPPVGLATDGVRHGVVIRRGAGLVLLPAGGGGPVALPPVASLAVPPCDRTPATGAAVWTLVRDVTYEGHLALDPEGEWDDQAGSREFGRPEAERLEVTAGRVCLRGLGVGRNVSSQAWLAATAGGQLAGVLDRASRVTCRPAPPRAEDN